MKTAYRLACLIAGLAVIVLSGPVAATGFTVCQQPSSSDNIYLVKISLSDVSPSVDVSHKGLAYTVDQIYTRGHGSYDLLVMNANYYTQPSAKNYQLGTPIGPVYSQGYRKYFKNKTNDKWENPEKVNGHKNTQPDSLVIYADQSSSDSARQAKIVRARDFSTYIGTRTHTQVVVSGIQVYRDKTSQPGKAGRAGIDASNQRPRIAIAMGGSNSSSGSFQLDSTHLFMFLAVRPVMASATAIRSAKWSQISSATRPLTAECQVGL